MTTEHPQPDRNAAADALRREAARAQNRFWEAMAVNEAESHVASLRRDQLLEERSAAVARVSMTQEAMIEAHESGDTDALADAIDQAARAHTEYQRVRQAVADELHEIVKGRMNRMAGLAAELGRVAEVNRRWLGVLREE